MLLYLHTRELQMVVINLETNICVKNIGMMQMAGKNAITE